MTTATVKRINPAMKGWLVGIAAQNMIQDDFEGGLILWGVECEEDVKNALFLEREGIVEHATFDGVACMRVLPEYVDYFAKIAAIGEWLAENDCESGTASNDPLHYIAGVVDGYGDAAHAIYDEENNA